MPYYKGQYLNGRSKSRRTRTLIEIYDTSIERPDSITRMFDPPEARFAVLCIDHNFLRYDKTEGAAWKSGSTSDEWCKGCKPGQTVKPPIKSDPEPEPEQAVEEPETDLRADGPLRGHEWECANICASCEGRLKADDGHYHQAMLEQVITRRRSEISVAVICCACAREQGRAHVGKAVKSA